MRVLFMVMMVLFGALSIAYAQASTAEQFFEKGTEAANAKDYETSIEAYKSSLKSVKKNKELRSKIHYNIGTCLYQQKKFKDAEKSFTKAVKLSKDKYVNAIYSLGLTQIELEKPGFAEANFRKVLGLDEKHAETWFDLGMVLLERKMFNNAKIAFEKSIEYKTTRLAEAQNNLGVISAMSGNIPLAKTQFLNAFLMSKGKLLLAKNNLEFWEKYSEIEFANRVAKN